MGRKIDLGTLTEEEEKRILGVIQRDFDLRRVESDRIGKISKDVESEETKQKEIVKEAVEGELPIDTLCARCGSKFMWLINPKAQCNGCDLYFCRNKIDCIVYDKVSKLCFCNACTKQRELHSISGAWFYSKLKGKFRRHGGAKVYRELHKKKGKKKNDPMAIELDDGKSHSPSSSAVSSPRTPHRKISDETKGESSVLSPIENDSVKENGILQNYDVEMDAVVIETTTVLETALPKAAEVQVNDIEIQTDDLGQHDPVDNNLPSIKEELEEAIAKLLLPKLEELKKIEQHSDDERQKKVEDAVKLAEEMIDQALERAKERSAAVTSPQPESRTSARSSLKDTATMTETSDSEIESVSSHSGRGRHLPLSERLGSLSPDSLRNTLNSQDSSSASITQGVVLQKDQLVARAEMDQAVAEILDEQGVRVDGTTSPQEFSTELKFTAVGGGKHQFSGRRSSSEDSDSDDEAEHSRNLLSENGNWVSPEPEKRPSQMRNIMSGNTNSSNSLMTMEANEKSPYEHMGESESDSDDREHVEEEQVLASVIRRPDSSIAPLSLVTTHVEVVETIPEKKPHPPVDVAVDPQLLRSLSEDIDKNAIEKKEVEKPTTPLVAEEMIQAVDRAAQESAFEEILQQDPSVTINTGRDSADSGIMSPVSMCSESELSVIPEATHEDRSSVDQDSHSSSEDESSDSESEASVSKSTSAMLLQPERHSSSHEHSTTSEHLQPEGELMAEIDEFGDKVAAALLQQSITFEPTQQEEAVAPSISSRSTSIHEEDIEDLDKHSVTSMSSMSQGDTYVEEEGSLTPTRDLDPGIEESAIAMRMVNTKSIELLSDTIQNIEEVKGQASDSDSSKTYSAPSSVSSHEEIHQLNEAEEKVYINAAQTFAMHEKLDLLEQEATSLNRSELDPARLRKLEIQVEYAEKEVEEIDHGGKSITERLQQLRGAGLEVQKGNYKRHSLGSATFNTTEEPKKTPTRHSLNIPQHRAPSPVNASNKQEPSWLKNTFTVIPAAARTIPHGPVDQSTPKPKSASSHSSRSRSSSESSDSLHSSIHSEEHNLHSSSYVSGISVEYEQKSPTPTPIPRQKKEVSAQGEDEKPVAKPRVEIEEKMDVSEESDSDVESLNHSEIVEEAQADHEIIASQEKVVDIVKKYEESVSSHSFSRSESGSEYTEPLIHQAIKTDSGSESEDDGDKSSDKSPRATDGWSLSRKRSSGSESHSDSELHSVDTPRSSRKGMFDSLTAAEQREMARIALMHLPETVIAEDHQDEREEGSDHDEEAEVIPSREVTSSQEVAAVQRHNDASSSEHSSSDDEEHEPQQKQVTRAQEVILVHQEEVTQVHFGKDGSSSEHSSSDEDDHEPQQKKQMVTPSQEVIQVHQEEVQVHHNKDVSSREHSASDDEDHDPLQQERRVNLGQKVIMVHQEEVTQVHHDEVDSSSEQSSSNDEDHEPHRQKPAIFSGQEGFLVHREEVTQVHHDKDVSSSEHSSSDEGDRDPPQQKRKVTPDQEVILVQHEEFTEVHVEKDASSSEHSSSEDEDHEPKQQRPTVSLGPEAILVHRAEVTEVHSAKDESSSEDSSSEDEGHGKEVTPGEIIQQEVIPSQAHFQEVTPRQHEEVAQVHFKEEVTIIQNDSPPEEELSLIARRKRQLQMASTKNTKPYGAYDYGRTKDSWKGTSQKTNLRHSYDGTTGREVERKAPTRHSMSAAESPTDIERATVVRGSITMRGGKKMVMTSSPDQSFEAIPE